MHIDRNRNNIKIGDEDLEIQMLQEIGESYGDGGGGFIKNGWVAGGFAKNSSKIYSVISFS